MLVSALILAGGSGLRMQSNLRKQYLKIDGYPILHLTLLPFISSELINNIILVIPPEDSQFIQNYIIADLPTPDKIKVVNGGTERQLSVYNGLCALDENTDIVLIHDGVRPFITAKQIENLIDGANDTGACILGIPISDTIKKTTNDQTILETVDRQNMYFAQTPQAFQFLLIKKAHEEAREQKIIATDDAALLENSDYTVKVIPGSPFNIKITHQEDLTMATMIKKNIFHNGCGSPKLNRTTNP